VTRAELRRALALMPETARLPLAARVVELAGHDAASRLEAVETLAAYVFDRAGGAILATSEARARWLDGPLFTWVGPGNAAPLDDALAALLVGPALVQGAELARAARTHRFAPRADHAIAIAVACLPPDTRERALAQLAGEHGPDEGTLALSALQCGRIVAWSPSLMDTAPGERAVDTLCRLLVRDRPRPLLEVAARLLGPIAAAGGPLAARIRDVALAALTVVDAPVFASFADEVRTLATPRALPELQRWQQEPARQLATASAFVLGYAAPRSREAFVAHRALVLDRPGAGQLDLSAAFVDGLIAACHVDALTELAAQLVTAGRELDALAIAARIPLDALAPGIVGELDVGSEPRRALACEACELLPAGDEIDEALAARLSDPSPDVVTAAARALDARGQRARIATHAARETAPLRRAIANATCGTLDAETIAELARDALPRAGDDGVAPTAQLLADRLFADASGRGLEVASDLVREIPAVLVALAPAVAAAGERDVGILAAPAAHALFATVVEQLTAPPIRDPDSAAIALYLLARLSAGDRELAARVAAALANDELPAPMLVAALGELRVADDATARALAPMLAASQAIGERVVAASVCGRALPAGHAAWDDVRALTELGTIAGAAAWVALRDRARRA
jgi:hypothetical protein